MYLVGDIVKIAESGLVGKVTGVTEYSDQSIIYIVTVPVGNSNYDDVLTYEDLVYIG